MQRKILHRQLENDQDYATGNNKSKYISSKWYEENRTMNEPESKKALNETEEEAISGGAFTKAAFRKSGKEPAAGIITW